MALSWAEATRSTCAASGWATTVTGLVFDGLYEYHRRALLLDRPPA
ncbi:hypothetical protein [Actinoplanes siamensis]|nr:hypothetical protein [Actinoplanes siamensis]